MSLQRTPCSSPFQNLYCVEYRGKKAGAYRHSFFLSNIPENEHFPKLGSLVLISAKKLSVFQR